MAPQYKCRADDDDNWRSSPRITPTGSPSFQAFHRTSAPQRSSNGDVICTRCSKIGHLEFGCKEFICHRCNQVGHVAKACRVWIPWTSFVTPYMFYNPTRKSVQQYPSHHSNCQSTSSKHNASQVSIPQHLADEQVKENSTHENSQDEESSSVSDLQYSVVTDNDIPQVESIDDDECSNPEESTDHEDDNQQITSASYLDCVTDPISADHDDSDDDCVSTSLKKSHDVRVSESPQSANDNPPLSKHQTITDQYNHDIATTDADKESIHSDHNQQAASSNPSHSPECSALKDHPPFPMDIPLYYKPTGRQVWCYKCSRNNHTFDYCPNQPSPEAVQYKLQTKGPYDWDDEWSDEDNKDDDGSNVSSDHEENHLYLEGVVSQMELNMYEDDDT